MTPKVLIVMGSDSDFPVMKTCVKVLHDFGIPFEIKVCSAHRTPQRAHQLARTAREEGFHVIIAAAGLAAHLAGVMAAGSTLPVIGIPMEGGALRGLDALYATVSMPGGIPVATMAIGKPGAKNAALFAAQILSLSDDKLAGRMEEFRKSMEEQVAAKNDGLPTQVEKFLAGKE